MCRGWPENGGRGLFTESIRADSLGREKARIIMLESGSPCTALCRDHCVVEWPATATAEWPATVPGLLQTLQSHYFSLCGVLEQLLTIKGIIVQWNCTTSVLHYSTELCCSVQ